MSYPVSYHCPRCGAVHEIDREGYLDDKTVTPYPLAGWTYADPEEPFDDADGVRMVCGDEALLVPDAELPGDLASTTTAATIDPDAGREGCGEPFYLSFVRFEDGREVEPTQADTDAETVALADEGPESPRGPDSPGGFWG